MKMLIKRNGLYAIKVENSGWLLTHPNASTVKPLFVTTGDIGSASVVAGVSGVADILSRYEELHERNGGAPDVEIVEVEYDRSIRLKDCEVFG